VAGPGAGAVLGDWGAEVNLLKTYIILPNHKTT
jgi:hypothetical protein